ncbi:MAG: lytic transglycosylase domain-containing protein [Burkholderiales bacterium]
MSQHHRSLSLAIAVVLPVTLLAGASERPAAPSSALELGAQCLPEEGTAAPARDPAEPLLAKYLSRRFLIATASAERMVGAAFRAAREVGLDPLVLLAVISVESRFNPIAQSVMGAKGLMQIIPKYHPAKLAAMGGDAAVWDPEANIAIGARILQEYVYRTGSLEAGLQFYNGAFTDGSAQYAQKVLAERSRLIDVLYGRESGAAVATRG